MKEDITEAEVLETNILNNNNELAVIIQESGLEKSKADRMLTQFNDFFKIASEWEEKSKACIVTDRTQVTEMKIAREGRLFLKNKRVEVEKVRKELKEQSLREGKAIDGVANVLKALIIPIEEQLESYEKFAELEDARIEAENKERRIELLSPYEADLVGFDLGKMTEDNFQALLDATKKKHEEKIIAERKAEEDRIAKEKADAEEREKQRLENERLKKEAEEKEKQLAEERAKSEQERKALEEKARKERKELERKAAEEKAKQDAILKNEREEKERLEAEIKAKADAEAKAKSELAAKEKAERERIEAEEKAKRLAPDKDKLLSFAESISSLNYPELVSGEANVILENTKGLLSKVVNYIKEQAEKI